jgi:hypothetical protein
VPKVCAVRFVNCRDVGVQIKYGLQNEGPCVALTLRALSTSPSHVYFHCMLLISFVISFFDVLHRMNVGVRSLRWDDDTRLPLRRSLASIAFIPRLRRMMFSVCLGLTSHTGITLSDINASMEYRLYLYTCNSI